MGTPVKTDMAHYIVRNPWETALTPANISVSGDEQSRSRRLSVMCCSHFKHTLRMMNEEEATKEEHYHRNLSNFLH